MSNFTIINTDGSKITTDQCTRDEVFVQIVQQIQKYIDRNHYSMILKAGTGFGKSVNLVYELYKQMPSYKIICAQPTVLNAISLAQFLEKKYSLQLGHNLGLLTGPQKQSVKTIGGILYATMGSVINKYLMPYMQNTNIQSKNQLIIIDEAHSNQTDYQIALGIIKYILKNVQNPPFFVIQSASIDLQQFSSYFNQNQFINVIGFQHKIIELYLDDIYKPNIIDQLKFSDISAHIVQSIKSKTDRIQKLTNEVQSNINGDILIFVPGKKLMDLVQKKIQNIVNGEINVICLSRETMSENPDIQEQINQPTQKVIICTNIAETGVTFKHATYVIDCAKFKSVYYDPVRKSEIIRDLPICRNMMQQRRGRVGRTQGGLYFCAMMRNHLQHLLPFREQQIQISNLKSQISQIGVSNFIRIQFIYQPPEEIQMDLVQASIFTGLEHCRQYPLYDLIVTKLPKLDLYYKMLLYISFIYGLKLCQVICLVIHLSREKPQKKQQKPLAGINDFIDIIEQIETTDKLYSGFCTEVAEIFMYFDKINISVYSGADVRQNVQIFNEAVSRSFQQYMMHKLKVEENYIIYQTDFGLQLRLKASHNDIKNAPERLITNGFTNQFQFQPQYLLDVSQNKTHYLSKCKQGVYIP